MAAKRNGIEGWLTKKDVERVAKAVTESEKGISGEIVVYVAPASDRYPEAWWEGAAYGMLLGTAVIVALDLRQPLWHSLASILAAVLAAGAAGALLGRYCAPATRRLVGPDRMDEVARRGAAAAFLEKEVFRTRDRTGILLFVSLLEHEVVVLGDSGINAKVAGKDWDGVVDAVTEALRGGRLADGLVTGVQRCRQILLEAGFKARPDDVDELPDAPGTGR